MHDPRDLLINEYLYDLPERRIAGYPLENRDMSKLLVYKRGGAPQQFIFHDLAEQLPADSLLVLNDTRVIHARLLFQKTTGARIEIFCLSPFHPAKELQTAFALQSPVTWECLVGNARRWKHGKLEMVFENNYERVSLVAERSLLNGKGAVKKLGAKNELINLSWSPREKSFSSVIEMLGAVPLPPYIHRESVESDKIRYQTVYARQEGSVAAPTAGLHFTPRVFNSLEAKGIRTAYLTLHVGAGTFKPVITERIGEHIMHAEPFEVSVDFIETLLENVDRQIIAVGTTSVRTLESIYHAGLRLMKGAVSLDDLLISQWEPYEVNHGNNITKREILLVLKDYLIRHKLPGLEGYTQLIIAPGYHFGLVDGMLTNFHQPGSTLLLLISAYLGDGWRDVYKFALDQDFRFLSYGDSCLFL
ncbi:MAG: S-adenosylmethionine:tRNA ribosyltransferase-isomerase [Bacteroidales bacterium]